MSKKLNKIIMDDFNKTYSIEVDKEKIYKNIQVKEEKEDNIQTVLYLKRLCKRISAAACLIIVCLIAVIGVMTINTYQGKEEDVVTKEFKEYIKQYTSNDFYNLYSLNEIEANVFFYVYKTTNAKQSKDYYFYIIKNNIYKKEYYLLINNEKLPLQEGTYGLLCEFSKDDTNKDICFSIEYNGKITDYKIG